MKLGLLMSLLVVSTTAAKVPKYKHLYINPFNEQWNGWDSSESHGKGQWPNNEMTGASYYGGGWMPDYGGMPGGDYGGGWNPGGGDYGGMPGGGDYGGWFPPMMTTTTPEPTTTNPPTCDDLKGSCVNSENDCESGAIGSGQCEGSSVCCVPPVLPDDICGLTSIQKIVGGSESEAHAWPWQVSLQTSSDFHFCGGSLINNQWVVTAAHCVEESETYQIVLGEHDRNVDHGPEVTRTTIKVIKHEDYHGEAPYPNDIALLKLHQPVEFTAEIYPACVPMSDDVFTKETECWISGWGDTKDTGDRTKLQEMRIDVVDNQSCGEKWGKGYILDTNICVGNGDIGACNGDSGGPLSCRGDSNTWMLAGATSWGISGCQSAGYPNVYTRISKYRQWIIEHIVAN